MILPTFIMHPFQAATEFKPFEDLFDADEARKTNVT